MPLPTSPASDPQPAKAPQLSHEDVILAVGRTVDSFNHRRTNDCLALLLTAQKEEVALFTQADALRNEHFTKALLEARQDYQQHIERAVTHILEELADGHTIPGALGQISDHVGTYTRRSERMHEKMLLAIRELGATITAGFAKLDATLAAATTKPAGEPARVLALVPASPAGHTASGEKPDPRSVFDKLDDDDDDLDMETHA